MARCDCGNLSGRILLKSTPDGKKLADRWVCPQCSPGDFPAERFGSLPDKRVWLMSEVEPNQYEDAGGAKRLKDWAQADLEARLGREDEDEVRMQQQARERKRRHAQEVRTMYGTKLRPDLERQMESELRTMRARQACEQMGMVLPG